jgi:AmmeMemoRadiSam system protein A
MYLPPMDENGIRAHQDIVLALAHESIAHGLTHGTPLSVKLNDYPACLTERTATFVTLKRNGELRGCIGNLVASRPLVTDVAENAFAAAFRDPRFAPLTQADLTGLEIQISLLSTPENFKVSSEQELVEKLRPGIDGLIMEEGPQRGTFLPSVWESLPDPVDFVRQLKLKSGLPVDYWSDTLHIQRYTTLHLPDHAESE